MKPIDVRDLLDEPGTKRAVRVDEVVEGLQVGMAEIDHPVGGDLAIESVSDGVWVSGRLRGEAEFACARCLKPFEERFDVEVGELFTTEPDEDEYAIAEPGEIDLEPMVRDAVLLAMPFSPLCRPDCKGLCPRCGGDRNLGECRCAEEQIDPRWAGLEGLLTDN